MDAKRKDDPQAWLGKGEMAEAIRTHDWSETPLGDIENWPQSLKTALGICLRCPSPVAVYWGSDFITLYNDVCMRLMGAEHPTALGRPARALPARLWEIFGAMLTAAFTQGTSSFSRNQPAPLSPCSPSEECRFDFTANPIADETGAIRGVFIIAFDITSYVRTAAELRISEQRFRTLAEATATALYRLDAPATNLVEVIGGTLPQHSRHDAPIGNWLEEYIHPDDHVATRAAWKHAVETGSPHRLELRVMQSDGSWRWTLSEAVPVKSETGEIVEWIGAATDIDERKRADQALAADLEQMQRLQTQQRVLVAELQHRTRNLLAVVRAIASQTFIGRGDECALESFLQRLGSLGRVQGLISRAEGDRVKLADIVWAELEAHGDGWRSRLEVHGPQVRLSSHQVQIVALALHELITNAVKYGALKAPAGRLSVTWETWLSGRGSPRLAIMWRESGVPMPVDASSRRGHGRELIEDALRFSLRADTQLVFGSDGVWCRIELPLDANHHRVLDPSHAQPSPR